MQRTLFGVAIPDGAVRILIRPVIGRGPTMPLYETTLAEGQPWPTETDVQIATAKDSDFWSYVDAKGQKEPEDGWEWKLRVQCVNNAGTVETFTTAGTHLFYRAVAASASVGAPDALHERALALLENLTRATERACDSMTKAHTEALKEAQAEASKALGLVGAEAAKAIAEAGKAAGAALAEASKQTSQVSDLAKALHTEAGELKEAIFTLQTERAKGATQAPKSAAGELKEFVETARTVIGLADGLAGAANPSPSPDPKAPASTPGDQ